MLEAKANEASKPNIDVDLKIIDSVQQLLMSVQAMIKNARTLQKEITLETVPTHFSKEHYKKNVKWSEGLTSAAKDIGGGANVLVDAANGVINGDGKFEELIAASQEIASSTAQVHKTQIEYIFSKYSYIILPFFEIIRNLLTFFLILDGDSK